MGWGGGINGQPCGHLLAKMSGRGGGGGSNWLTRRLVLHPFPMGRACKSNADLKHAVFANLLNYSEVKHSTDIKKQGSNLALYDVAVLIKKIRSIFASQEKKSLIMERRENVLNVNAKRLIFTLLYIEPSQQGMDKIAIKTPNPKCRLYRCLI